MNEDKIQVIGIETLQSDKVDEINKENARLFKAKADEIKHNAFVEMNDYIAYVDDFLLKAQNLAIFRAVIDEQLKEHIKFTLIDEVVNELAKPIYQGEKPPYMTEEEFTQKRIKMFEYLVSKYKKR